MQNNRVELLKTVNEDHLHLLKNDHEPIDTWSDRVSGKQYCDWDLRTFDHEAFGIPLNFDRRTNKYNCFGCFCSPQCARAYIFDRNMHRNVYILDQNIVNMARQPPFNYPRNKPIGMADHYKNIEGPPFFGKKSLKEFRKNAQVAVATTTPAFMPVYQLAKLLKLPEEEKKVQEQGRQQFTNFHLNRAANTLNLRRTRQSQFLLAQQTQVKKIKTEQ